MRYLVTDVGQSTIFSFSGLNVCIVRCFAGSLPTKLLVMKPSLLSNWTNQADVSIEMIRTCSNLEKLRSENTSLVIQDER